MVLCALLNFQRIINMKINALLLAGVLLGLSPLASHAQPPAPGQNAASFTETQRGEIESIIKTYLTDKNPEVLAEGLQTLQRREREEASTKMTQAIAANKKGLFDNANSPSAGNPKATITVVEFYDYQCGYCKMSSPTLERLMKEDKDIKVVYKNFPVLGPLSTEAAKAAVASGKQGKFAAFHSALMSKKERLTKEQIYSVAQEVGVDVTKLKKDMADKSVEAVIDADITLAGKIGIEGTPFFVINDDFAAGALPYEGLKSKISAARAKTQKP